MTYTQEIDNGIELGDVILWQYQNAENLKRLVAMYDDFYRANVRDFSDNWREKVFNIEKPSDFATNATAKEQDALSLSLWGLLLGFSRPTYKNSAGKEKAISDDLYRKLIKARFRVMRSNASLPSIIQYVHDAFGENVTVEDTADMALHYNIKVPLPSDVGEDVKGVLTQNIDSVMVYPAGVKTNEPVDEYVFGFSGQQKVSDTDPDVGGLDDSTFCAADH